MRARVEQERRDQLEQLRFGEAVEQQEAPACATMSRLRKKAAKTAPKSRNDMRRCALRHGRPAGRGSTQRVPQRRRATNVPASSANTTCQAVTTLPLRFDS